MFGFLYLVVIVAPALATAVFGGVGRILHGWAVAEKLCEAVAYATYLGFALFTMFHLTMPEDPDYPQIGIVLWAVPSVIAWALWVLTYHIVLCRTELEELAAGPGLTVTGE